MPSGPGRQPGLLDLPDELLGLVLGFAKSTLSGGDGDG